MNALKSWLIVDWKGAFLGRNGFLVSLRQHLGVRVASKCDSNAGANLLDHGINGLSDLRWVVNHRRPVKMGKEAIATDAILAHGLCACFVLYRFGECFVVV